MATLNSGKIHHSPSKDTGNVAPILNLVPYGRVVPWLYKILILAPVGGMRSLSCPCCLTTKEKAKITL